MFIDDFISCVYFFSSEYAPRSVVLQKGPEGYGFVLRGAKCTYIWKKYFKNKKKVKHTNLMTEFLYILPTEKSFTFFSDFVFHFFFNLAYVRNCTAVSLVQFPLVQFTRSLEFLLIYIFFGLKEKFSMWYSELKNLESPLSFALRAVYLSVKH